MLEIAQDEMLLDDVDPEESVFVVVPDRPATCSRPPCLKRTALPAVASPFSSSSPPGAASPSSSYDSNASSSTRSVSSPTAPTNSFRSYSFSQTSRCLSESLGVRAPRRVVHHVHFDVGPPEAFDTHSAADYDRSQIECTQGGSEFDLRLSSSCKRYNDNGEEENGEGDGDEDSISGSSPSSPLSAANRSMPFGANGSTGWACLKRGSVIASLTAPRITTRTSEPGTDSGLPNRGLRSFGGLAHKGILSQSDGVTTDSQDDGDDADKSQSILGEDDSSTSTVGLSSLKGNVAFEAAALASKSPDATPKPSPSIVPRWAHCADYFASATSDEEDEVDVNETALPTRVNTGSEPIELLLPTKSSETDIAAPVTVDVVDKADPPLSPTQTSTAAADAAVGAQSGVSAACMSRSDSDRSSITTASALSSRRPSLTRPKAFLTNEIVPGTKEADTFDIAPSLDITQSFLGLKYSETPSESAQSLHSASSPSPLSSRCSSVDPWAWTSSSCMSSNHSADSDDERAAGLIHSPLAVDVGHREVSESSSSPPAEAAASQFGHETTTNSLASVELEPTSAHSATSSACPTTLFKTAISRIQAQMMDRSGDHGSNQSSVSSSLSSTIDEEGRAVSQAEDLSRCSSSSCKTTRHGSGDRKPKMSRRSSSRSSSSGDHSPMILSDGENVRRCSSRKASLNSPLRTPDADDSEPSVDVSSTSKRKSSRSSSASSSRSGSWRPCSAASAAMWNTCDSIEDEGALGGF